MDTATPPYAAANTEPVPATSVPAEPSTKDELLSIAAEISAVGSSIPYPGVTDSGPHSGRLMNAVKRLRKVAEGM
jgi:hypothetical protein